MVINKIQLGNRIYSAKQTVAELWLKSFAFKIIKFTVDYFYQHIHIHLSNTNYVILKYIIKFKWFDNCYISIKYGIISNELVKYHDFGYKLQ